MLWHIYNGHLTKPSNYYFFSPKDCGPSLKKLLLDSNKLKKKVIEEWDNWCSGSITTTGTIKLEGEFNQFVEEFDFSIFQYKARLDVIDEHRNTPHFIARFGGGLPERPAPHIPSTKYGTHETRYIEQLFEAYSDHKNLPVEDIDLTEHPKLDKHFNRQREAFYHAESLKSFARDSVPEGTYEALQDEVHCGVVDIEEDDHEDAFKRLQEVTKAASILGLSANGLIQVVNIKDRHGICHQLANEDRLTWRKDDE